MDAPRYSVHFQNPGEQRREVHEAIPRIAMQQQITKITTKARRHKNYDSIPDGRCLQLDIEVPVPVLV